MFQNKKLKRNATYAIAEVAEVALCASNCALPTSVICHKKRASFFALFYKTRANTQQVLLVQTGLYLSDEWMVQDINDKNFNGS